MKTIGDTFGDDRLLNNDRFIPICYEAYKDIYNTSKVDVEKIYAIIRISKDNVWFKYFLSAYNKELGWIDFEREIAKVICAFEEFFVDCDDVENIEFPDDAVYKYIISKFSFFYENQPTRLFGSGLNIEKEHYLIKKDYRLEEPYGSSILVIDVTKIIDKLYKELLKVSELLKLYLDVFVNNLIQQMVDKQLITKNSAFNHSQHIITFNYTDTFEKMYDSNNVCHIHGSLNDQIILGINPDSNDEPYQEHYPDTAFLKFKKYYQRVLNGSDMSYLNAIRQIKEHQKRYGTIYSYELYVAGHSLDVTDEDIIKEVFAMINKIVIICHSTTAIADSINNLIRIYGKHDFDELRARTDLEFKLYSDFE